MKNLKKIFMALLCVMIISVGLTGCDKTSSQIEAESQEAIKAANLESVRIYTENIRKRHKSNRTLDSI